MMAWGLGWMERGGGVVVGNGAWARAEVERARRREAVARAFDGLVICVFEEILAGSQPGLSIVAGARFRGPIAGSLPTVPGRQ